MSDDLVKQFIAELQDLVQCRCHEAFKGRGLHDPDCHCDTAEAVKVVADRIEELEAKLAKALEALETIAFERAGDEAAYTARTEDEVWNEAIEAAASTVAPPVTEQDSDRPEFFDAMDEVLDTRWHRIRALARPTKGETK